MTENNTMKPAPPKRPQCAFFIFKQEVYQQVKNENPGKKMTDITKLISEQYKLLSKEKIDEYEQKYKDTKVIFEKNKKIYEDQHGKIRNEKRKKRKNNTSEEKKSKKQPTTDAKGSTQVAKKTTIESDDDSISEEAVVGEQ